ncbi:hypothetical protein G6F40_014275 [Rhizopus arrhizus]|nr:hypothetical protein G6F40_014275 [Rhizopus arrhizus]
MQLVVAEVLQHAAGLRLWQGPQLCPDAGVRPLLQQYALPGVAQQQRHRFAFGQRLAGLGRGQFGSAAFAARNAVVVQRADHAGRFRAAADGRAQVHLRLGVVGHASGWDLRHMCLGDRPQLLLDGRQAGEAVDAVVAAEYALDVAVEDCERVVPGLAEDRASGAAADAGQRVQCIEIARQVAA